MGIELIIAGLAAAAVLLITIGLASRPPKDAVQTRLEQLVVQPKTLEEFELQQPFFERVMRPMVKRLSRVGSRGDQGGMIARTDAKLEKAGYPGGLRGADWMGVKILGAIVGAILGFFLGLAIGGIAARLRLRPGWRRDWLHRPRVLARPAHPRAFDGHGPPAAGRA